MKPLRFSVGWLIPVITLAASLALYKLDPLPLKALRNAAFDQYQRWDNRPHRESSVGVIDIDDESLKRMGQWPWPRTRLAELVRRLQEAGVAAIAMDMVFAEPDRTAPRAMVETWQASPSLRSAIAALPDHDAIFAEQIGKGSVVLGHVLRNDVPLPPDFYFPFMIRTKGPSPLPYLNAFNGSVASLPDLQAAASGHGSFNFVSDSDGVIRTAPLLLRMGDEIMPSLVLEALRVALGVSAYVVNTSSAEGAGVESVRIGNITIPTTNDGSAWIRFTHGWQSRTIPAWKILAGEVPREALEGRLLFVGTSAAGLMDLRFSPLGGLIPGVEAHAHLLEQILAADHIVHPNWAPALEITLMVVGGLLIGMVALTHSALVATLLCSAILGLAFGGGWYAYSVHGLLLDPATPGLALVLTFIIASLFHHIQTERRQRWVKQAFARYVSPNLVAHLVENPGELELGGSRRECSFIFTDLAGFTSLMEKLDPARAVALLNEYLDNMIRIAFKHEGTLDRIVGDAVAIMFSAPVEQPDHRQRAVRCAEEMHLFASRFSTEAKSRGVPFGVTRIGVHSGEVTVGNFGGTTIFDYRALGDPVNTASRLESVNKQLGTLVCVSEATLPRGDEIPARPVGKLVLKGKTRPLMVYQPLFSVKEGGCAPMAEYFEAYDMMVRNAPEARVRFEALARSWPLDSMIAFHLKRLASGQEGDTIVFTEK